VLLLFPPLLSVVAGWIGAPGFLHPLKRPFTPDMVRDADVTFKQIGAQREDFDVRAAMALSCADGRSRGHSRMAHGTGVSRCRRQFVTE